ncbi:MAG: hypothetical protein ABFS41_09590, partial [Myxococcota bacterium]
ELARETEAAEAAVASHMRDLRLHEALGAVIGLSGAANRYLDGQAPWKAAKQPDGTPVVRRSLAHTGAVLHRIATLLEPFLPGLAAEIARRLGTPGARITKGTPLVPRLELPSEE